jgi:hypothetical protein
MIVREMVSPGSVGILLLITGNITMVMDSDRTTLILFGTALPPNSGSDDRIPAILPRTTVKAMNSFMVVNGSAGII